MFLRPIRRVYEKLEKIHRLRRSDEIICAICGLNCTLRDCRNLRSNEGESEIQIVPTQVLNRSVGDSETDKWINPPGGGLINPMLVRAPNGLMLNTLFVVMSVPAFTCPAIGEGVPAVIKIKRF